MSYIPGKPASYWIDSTAKIDDLPSGNVLSVDVAIVGGGLIGITAATLLKRAGKRVAVIEAESIGMGTSGHTTAKITSLHQLIYADLIDKIGEEKARLYAESNEAAIAWIAKMVEEEGIDCDFSRQSAYTFAESEKDLSNVEKEVNAALKLGLPACLVQETSLPFPIAGAVKFDNQAQFHIRKYLLHLAKNIPGDGSYILEGARVEEIEEGEPCTVKSNKGTVQATDVIVATHLPILNEGLFFAKSYPKRSYIVGARIPADRAPQGMFIGAEDKNYYSIRTTPYEGDLLLLVGGEGHKVGEKTDTEECYLNLEAYARDRFGVDSFEYRWSTQDMVSFDRLPYVGKLTPLNHHIYVATGMSLWGMSKGTMAGMLLSDLILGKENPWAELYDSLRATPFLSGTSIKENAGVATHMIGDRLKGLMSSISDVEMGEGKLVTVDGDKVAAYRDETGELHAVSAVCSHLGCIVNWNSAEKSWDCPCHGARFDCDGQILHGPAVKPLESLKGQS
ncbi:FAD-dependent oxidoreductase [Oscillatoria sp. FACHB-1406]|uniref:FAD-dependent oxidoreductase n=1 Tax=Oscillatoria sp. FACHB-1406 TaxID=2692846 RepID=UPI00168A2989|nr:FAD-dependent oxidoreductase [Oscillatoria sp. FACHB-1406]MBD2577612.1 FAD-dependent oxidoreductase [Oscillatoria sp. FACHB-1406]